MRTYYPSIEAIHQQTMQLQSERCTHCGQTHQLVSHGFIRKKQRCGDLRLVGKRVFCSNRHHHSGCGRTMQLYLDSTLRYLHYAGRDVVIFVLLLLTGVSTCAAYTQATGACTPRHAYRWVQRLFVQITIHRSLFHQPLLEFAPTHPTEPAPQGCIPSRDFPHARPHLKLLTSTLAALLHHFKQPLCQAFQSQLQRSFF